ncbi:MAG: ribonuclease HI [Halobacteriales archaeon]
MPVVECDVETARQHLENAGITVEPGNTEHERWRAKRDEATAVAYDGKVVIQGNRPERIEALLREGGGRVHLYFDGASHGNPGPAAIGWVLVSGDGIVTEGSSRIGEATNNQAEYRALLAGLETAVEYGFDEIQIRGDSELVIKQVQGTWDTNDPTLREHRVRAHELLREFDTYSLTHVPREVNDRADALATEALEEG